MVNKKETLNVSRSHKNVNDLLTSIIGSGKQCLGFMALEGFRFFLKKQQLHRPLLIHQNFMNTQP